MDQGKTMRTYPCYFINSKIWNNCSVIYCICLQHQTLTIEKLMHYFQFSSEDTDDFTPVVSNLWSAEPWGSVDYV